MINAYLGLPSKPCKACGALLDLTAFPIINRTDKTRQPKDGHGPNCKPCVRRKQREWCAANKDKVHAAQLKQAPKRRERQVNYNLQNMYGITLAEKTALVNAQGNMCAICGDDITERRSHVDHCHRSNRIRGILCGRCNVGIGMLKDDSYILQIAVEYLS